MTVAVFLLAVLLSETRARAWGLALLALLAGCAEDLPVRKQEVSLAAPGVYRLGLVLAGHHLPQASAIMAGVGAAQAERLGAGCASHSIEGVSGSESTKVKPGKDGADPEVEELTLLGAWLRCGAGR